MFQDLVCWITFRTEQADNQKDMSFLDCILLLEGSQHHQKVIDNEKKMMVFSSSRSYFLD